MGPMWPFLLMFESRVRHSFVALRHSMATCIPRVDGSSTDPPGLGHHSKSIVPRRLGY